MPPFRIASILYTPAILNTSTTWLCPADDTHKTQPRLRLDTTKLPNSHTAVARATTSTSVASIDNSNVHIVNKLYTQPVPTQNHPPPPTATTTLPTICPPFATSAPTILHASQHKGAGVNNDSIDIYRPSPSKHPSYINKPQLHL